MKILYIEGWVNTNPWYFILLLTIFTLPVTLPAIWYIYTRFIRSDRRKELEVALTLKQEKKAERDRRKEIKRKKSGNR